MSVTQEAGSPELHRGSPFVSARGPVNGRMINLPTKLGPACASRVSIEWYAKNCDEGPPYVTVGPMTHVLIGYAR